MDGIDPEFIAALPPELQAEVLEQQRRERRLRQAAARRAEAQQQVRCHVGGLMIEDNDPGKPSAAAAMPVRWICPSLAPASRNAGLLCVCDDISCSPDPDSNCLQHSAVQGSRI